jgi:hypothetical protein
MEINAKTVTYESEKASLLLKHQAALAATNAEVLSFDRLIYNEREVQMLIHIVTARIIRSHDSEAWRRVEQS